MKVKAAIHYEFHKRLEKLKTCYGPFNPDADTRSLFRYSRPYHIHFHL